MTTHTYAILVTCGKCGFSADSAVFQHGLDFFQKPFIAACPKCDNRNSPGQASMNMFAGTPRPFKMERYDPSCGATIKELAKERKEQRDGELS